jgi:preprotein translocase subunit SecE
MGEMRSERRAARRAARAEPPVPAARPQAQPVAERRRSNFFTESWAELKKVEWPNQNQVVQGTVVVLIACLVVGVYLYANDEIWKRVVSKVFLGQ